MFPNPTSDNGPQAREFEGTRLAPFPRLAPPPELERRPVASWNYDGPPRELIRADWSKATAVPKVADFLVELAGEYRQRCAWPRIRTMARILGIPEATARVALNWLVASGWCARQRVQIRGKVRDVYWLLWMLAQPAHDFDFVLPDGARGPRLAPPPRGAAGRAKGAAGCAQPAAPKQRIKRERESKALAAPFHANAGFAPGEGEAGPQAEPLEVLALEAEPLEVLVAEPLEPAPLEPAPPAPDPGPDPVEVGAWVASVVAPPERRPAFRALDRITRAAAWHGLARAGLAAVELTPELAAECLERFGPPPALPAPRPKPAAAPAPVRAPTLDERLARVGQPGADPLELARSLAGELKEWGSVAGFRSTITQAAAGAFPAALLPAALKRARQPGAKSPGAVFHAFIREHRPG